MILQQIYKSLSKKHKDSNGDGKTYINIPKNTLIPLTITSVNVKDTNLSADSDSVYFKQSGDFVYVGFTSSDGPFNVKVEGFDLSSNIMSSDKNFVIADNNIPTGNNAEFNIKSNEVLKFDANTYFSDSDGDILSFSNTEASRGKVQINDNVISYYPEQSSYSTSFTITATDTDNAEVTATFSVNVEFVSDIEIAYGWNLLGNSLSDKDINTSAILKGDEVIYRFSDNGFWEMSNLSYNPQYIKPTEGFWIKAENDRYLSVTGVISSWESYNLLEASTNSIYGATSQIIGDYIYIFGGRYNSTSDTNKIYRASISTPYNFEELNITLPTPISWATSILLEVQIMEL